MSANKRKNKRHRNTTQQAVIYRIKQEMKYVYNKKQHLKHLLYEQHLQGAEYYKVTWQHARLKIHHTLSNVIERICVLAKQYQHLSQQNTNGT